MKVAPTSYFPNVAYCAFLKENEKVHLDLGEHFVKQSIRNRAYLLGPNSILKIIVPLQRWKNNSSVKDIRISYNENWQKLHWKTLESCYRSSPYFEYYEDKFRKIMLEEKFDFLHDLNLTSLHLLIDLLDLDTELVESIDYIEPTSYRDDFRKRMESSYREEAFKNYIQVFGKNDFSVNLSFLDLVCNEGPRAIELL